MHQTKVPNLNLSLFHISGSAPSSMLVVAVFLDKSTKNFQEDICDKSKTYRSRVCYVDRSNLFSFSLSSDIWLRINKRRYYSYWVIWSKLKGTSMAHYQKKTVRLFTFLNQILINWIKARGVFRTLWNV